MKIYIVWVDNKIDMVYSSKLKAEKSIRALSHIDIVATIECRDVQ